MTHDRGWNNPHDTFSMRLSAVGLGIEIESRCLNMVITSLATRPKISASASAPTAVVRCHDLGTR